MADEADLAYEVQERALNAALAARKTDSLTAIGRCHYCETEFDPDVPETARKLFCDADCAQDYEAERRQRQRNGRA